MLMAQESVYGWSSPRFSRSERNVDSARIIPSRTEPTPRR